ncbi:hypothetical protein FIU86_06125 [Roseovarius sp. THAF9]|nr:hypothetical protein FIU86_06125 [Roseovarius sp. THAF9]
MNGPDMIKRALALAAKDETLAQVLRAHPAERFRLYALSAGDAHANLSLMPKPVDAPDAQILLGLWYWSFAFGLVWAQYTPHDDWRRLYLSPDSRELIRETLQDSLGEVEFTAIAPEDAQGSILDQGAAMRGARSVFPLYRRRLRVLSCRSEQVARAFDARDVQAPFVAAVGAANGSPEVPEWERRVVFFETDAAFGLWDWHHWTRVARD